MIREDVKALTERFKNEWQDAAPVFYDNQPDAVVPNDKPAVFFAVRPDATRHYMGSSAEGGTMKAIGRVWLKVSIPPQTGSGKAYSLIERFATIFRNWCSDDYAIQCETEQVGQPMQDRDSKMIEHTVSVPYTSLRNY